MIKNYKKKVADLKKHKPHDFLWIYNGYSSKA